MHQHLSISRNKVKPLYIYVSYSEGLRKNIFPVENTYGILWKSLKMDPFEYCLYPPCMQLSKQGQKEIIVNGMDKTGSVDTQGGI